VRGLYAFGEVNFAYHGANRLGANALLSCLFDGLFCGVSVTNYLANDAPSKTPAATMPATAFDASVKQEEAKVKALLDTAGKGGDAATNPYLIHKELGQEMTAACTVVKSQARLEQCQNKLGELKARYANVKLSDTASWTNQTLSFTRAVGDMLAIADAIAAGSISRKESRGAHYRTDFPTRDDANFMKTTLAKWDATQQKATVEFVPIDSSLILPKTRSYV
jgi:succinate dehydrogenase / fumarate reductase flavoprotein subunit